MDLLQTFLNAHEPQAQEVTIWGQGRFPLQVVSYFCDQLPPLELVTSVRGIVLHNDQVLVVRNRDETHIVPGGRREPGETPAETLEREILEETGWLTGDYHLLGVWHFHHLSSKPANFPHPHPDFLHLLYRAEALEHRPHARLVDDFELEHHFMPLDATLKLAFKQPSQIKFLKLATTRA